MEHEKVRVRVPQIKDVRAAVRMYAEKYTLGQKDIMELFGCGSATAQKLKRVAAIYEEEKEIMHYSRTCVYTENAFIAWGIDITKIQKRVKMLDSLEG